MPYFLFLLLTLLLGCGLEPLSPLLYDHLRDEYDNKLAELREASNAHAAGWPSDEDCDAALWAGVARAAGADWVDMSAALQEDGRPTRRPYFDCSVPDESKATTSNDMMTGIILGLLSANDTASLQRFWDYGTLHAWVMGYPEWYAARVVLRPNGITLAARALHHMSGGRINYTIRFTPILYGPSDADYGNHLTLLSRLTQRKAGGPQYGTEIAEQILAKTYPKDALAQAMAGNRTAAALLLLNDYESPSYVRGHPNYHLVHWLLAARILLES